MLVKIGKAASLLGVSSSTLRVWDKQGKFPVTCCTKGKPRCYELTRLWDYIARSQQDQNTGMRGGCDQSQIREQAEEEEENEENEEDDVERRREDQRIKHRPQVLAYTRVSGHKQKNDLKTQVEDLRRFAQNEGWQLTRVHNDIASRMNEQRPGLIRLLKQVATERPHAVLCTYKDRLARFGIGLIELLCEFFGSSVICIQGPNLRGNGELAADQQLVDDVLALLTSFAGKTHPRRRGSNGGELKCLVLPVQEIDKRLDSGYILRFGRV